MPKLTIEIDGGNSTNCKIFVDNKQISLIQEIQLKANANTLNLEVIAVFPKFNENELPQNSIMHEIPGMIKLLESCGVKCKLKKSNNSIHKFLVTK
jgi:hypothetical protein